MPGDQLIGYVIEIVADDVRLRSNSQYIVAVAFDQRSLPAGRNGAERVPSMAGDQTKFGGRNAELFLDVGVGLG